MQWTGESPDWQLWLQEQEPDWSLLHFIDIFLFLSYVPLLFHLVH
jgi:hypothetical protein